MPSRNPNLVEAVVRELAVVMAEAVEVAEVATNTDRRVLTATHHQAGKESAVTVAYRILRGNALHMDRTVTPVVILSLEAKVINTWQKIPSRDARA